MSLSHGKVVDLNLKMKYSHEKHSEEVTTILRTRTGQIFYIDRSEFRAELQADEHPSKKNFYIIQGKVYKKVKSGKDLLVSRPKMTIALGKNKQFTVEDRLRRKLFVKISPQEPTKKQ